jgi:SSS family solute:Na+ symporter
MAAHVLMPDLANVNNAFAAIVKASLPDGIRGLVIAAALAAMMSTASAGLLAASTTLTEDLLPKLRGGKQSSLGINRLFTLLTGLVVLGIALVVNDVISALTLAYNLLVGGMLIPLIGAIFWKRRPRRGLPRPCRWALSPRWCSCSRMGWMPTRRSTTAWRWRW